MRLLHTGDLHLDSAFCAYGEKDAQRLRKEGRELLCRIFECAKEEKCDMILFAGDVFDSKTVTPETGELFCSLVEKCNIPVVVTPGNHDNYSQSSFYAKAAKRLGEKLILFTSSELQIFDFDDLRVSVFGYAFTNPMLTQSPLLGADVPKDNGYTRIFCGHADMSSPVSRYAPITLPELGRFGFSYCALGHIHNRGDREDVIGRVRYCGFAQGRGFDELGEGGVWIVDIDGNGCECKRRILSETAFYILNSELLPSDDVQSAKEKVKSDIKQKNYSKGAHLRLVMMGVADSATVSALEDSLDEIKNETDLEYIELLDETLPLLDGEYLMKDTTLRGELYRTLLPKLSSIDPQEKRRAVLALRIGLAAIDGKEIIKTR